MRRPDEQLPVVYLRAGDMHYTDRPSVVITVLGSCLSVTMHNRRLGIAGICHGLLPECSGKKSCANGCTEGFRFVDCSIRQMLGIFEKAGAKPGETDVKYFGGADMFARKADRHGFASVGRQNIQTAEKVLKREGFNIVTQDVGGLRGRKIYFYTETGEVYLKRLAAVENPDIDQNGT